MMPELDGRPRTLSPLVVVSLLLSRILMIPRIVCILKFMSYFFFFSSSVFWNHLLYFHFPSKFSIVLSFLVFLLSYFSIHCVWISPNLSIFLSTVLLFLCFIIFVTLFDIWHNHMIYHPNQGTEWTGELLLTRWKTSSMELGALLGRWGDRCKCKGGKGEFRFSPGSAIS